MADTLDDAWAKLERAGEHIKDLEREVRRFKDSRPYRVTGDSDLQSGEYVLRIKPEEPPKRIGVLIGDVLSNLRPSLDYLIGALAVLDSGKTHPSHQFPICDTPAAFKRELAKGRLAGLSHSHAAAIEKLQPYPRRKAKAWLGRLRDYSNPDKHRHLTVLLNQIDGDFGLPPPPKTPPVMTTNANMLKITSQPLTIGEPVPLKITSSFANPGPIILNTSNPDPSGIRLVSSANEPTFSLVPSVAFEPTVIGTSVAQAREGPPKRNVHVELNVSVGVAFPEGTPVVETLEIFESQISKLLNAFEREF